VGIKIEIAGDEPATLTTLDTEAKEIVVTDRPSIITSNSTDSLVIEVLKGAPGDDRVSVGDTPPDNPQEGWIWIDTSGG
jgi:hypothetical protein